jgi:hypothetical protein
MNPYMLAWGWNFVLIGLIKTVVTGGLSMAIFFPIFLIIFPDYNAVQKRAAKKLERLRASNASADKLGAAQLAYNSAAAKAELSNAEKAKLKAATLAAAKALAYFAAVKNAQSDADPKISAAFSAAAAALTAKTAAIEAHKALTDSPVAG